MALIIKEFDGRKQCAGTVRELVNGREARRRDGVLCRPEPVREVIESGRLSVACHVGRGAGDCGATAVDGAGADGSPAMPIAGRNRRRR